MTYCWILLNCLYCFLVNWLGEICFSSWINCCVWSFALFSLPNNLFCVNIVRRIYILINWLVLKVLKWLATYSWFVLACHTIPVSVSLSPVFLLPTSHHVHTCMVEIQMHKVTTCKLATSVSISVIWLSKLCPGVMYTPWGSAMDAPRQFFNIIYTWFTYIHTYKHIHTYRQTDNHTHSTCIYLCSTNQPLQSLSLHYTSYLSFTLILPLHSLSLLYTPYILH